MSWEIHKLGGALGRWRGTWDALNHSLYRTHPLFDSRFVEPMLAHFGNGQEWLCVHRRDGRVDGLLILVPRQLGVWTSFLPAQCEASPVLLERPEDIAGLFATLPISAGCVELLNQDPDFSTISRLAPDPLVEWHDHVTTMNVQLTGNFETYWQGRSKNLQKNIRRHLNRIKKDLGSVSLVVHTNQNNMAAAVSGYGDLESKGWKGRAGTAVRAGNVQGDFYLDVLCRFAESGDARIYELYLHDTLAASRLCIGNGDTLVILKTTYDELAAAYAPGRVLLHALLKAEFAAQHYRIVEFYTHATADQLQWSTGARPIRHITIYRGHLARRVMTGLKVAHSFAKQLYS